VEGTGDDWGIVWMTWGPFGGGGGAPGKGLRACPINGNTPGPKPGKKGSRGLEREILWGDKVGELTTELGI